MINIRPATIKDIQAFPMSEQDRRESISLFRQNGEEALLRTFNNSKESYVAEDEGKTICLFGCIPSGPGANFWLLFPAGIDKLPMSFFRLAEPVIDELLEKYEFLLNYAHKDKLFIIRLSKWLGFAVDAPEPYGIDGELFHRVWKRRERLCA